jgi:predicted ATPase
MLKSITLGNFRSFGQKVTVPLEPISVLVGPNNSGKSAFMSIGEFVRDCLRDARFAIANAGGADFAVHRPAVGLGLLEIGWTICAPTGNGNAATGDDCYATAMTADGFAVPTKRETLRVGDEARSAPAPINDPLSLLRGALSQPEPAAQALARPLLESRSVKLSLDKLRADSLVGPADQLSSDGDGIAAAVGRWRGFEVDKAERLDAFLRGCAPELKRVLANASPSKPGWQRLWVEQADGTRFDAEHTSDGVLFMIGLAMHVLDAPREAVIFIDEPENSIHPRRLVDLVELLRKGVAEAGCQFVIATHSPVLLREFRDEPEAVLLFRRGDLGTEVTALSEVPRLVDALERSHPGELLADGFFNDPL